jgi:cephalosporin hydroxylase
MYEQYDRYLSDLSEHPIVLMELGVYTGESLKVFASFFSNGRVIGVDCEDHRVDLSAYSNATLAFGDQRDGAWLAALAMREAPDGLDIVIDDASHRGAWSFTSYCALFPLLKPGGLYVIEDWGTGYIEDWPDGARFVAPAVRVSERMCKQVSVSLPYEGDSHDEQFDDYTGTAGSTAC